MQPDWFMAFGLVATATLIAMACLLMLSALHPQKPPPPSIFAGSSDETVFIFDGEALLDATPPARALITSEGSQLSPWFQTLARLDPVFPGLSTRLQGLQSEGRFVLCSREDLLPPMVLRAESIGGLTRLSLHGGGEEKSAVAGSNDGLAELALRDELRLLREILSRAPLPVWHEGPGGEVTWANGRYLALAAGQLGPGQELSWPLPSLFPQTAQPALAKPGTGADNRRPIPFHPQTRQGASPQDSEGTRWFQLLTLPSPGALPGRGQLCYALPADAQIEAEKTLREFTQTLAKTFAQLPIGLAIFDHARVLQMFNPALLDLTGLPVDFLIARPGLAALLDAMREQSKLPEPRDYRSWRQQMAEMEKAAAEGLYQEIWALPSGQTWRVSGRPHPNGALAFMIEDISTEMSRTRRYRADLELGQAVIDGLADAVVVFAQDGSLVMANKAAAALWGGDFSQGAGSTATSVRPIAEWRNLTAPSLLWDDLEAFIGLFGPRSAWEADLRLTDGRALTCRVAPMPHGATLVTFALRRAGLENAPGSDPPLAQLIG